MDLKRQAIFNILKQAEKEVMLEVCSDSMKPTINANDFISVHLSDSLDCQLGDIVLFSRGDAVIVHRIIKKKELDQKLFFCEKGDNACSWTWISEKDILGRVVSIADRDKLKKVTQRQLTRHNRIIGFLGWGLVSLFETLYPDKKQPSGKATPFFVVSIRNLLFRIVNRLFLLIGSAICRTTALGKNKTA